MIFARPPSSGFELELDVVLPKTFPMFRNETKIIWGQKSFPAAKNERQDFYDLRLGTGRR
jgi:hypothetical protein